ncbi:MaoC family dehydratase [Variovorax sp.]|jgi:acyl dehydratase|uniref:MaoC family dehydratase n=1 Tax=Variovorax sp. TaxID=1871043 RepID=UPI0013801E70|nr:MaoC family dehydratase [Variovorax sp.]KAF1066115.1 MAG: putative enoyl-CoA hydratase 1 [Variovorax sp.]
MQTFASIAELKAFEGKEAGPSAWHEVTQAQVQLFADATGDHQWIHLDPERARRESPFGGPVAHGFLTLSLLPMLTSEITRFEGTKARINYGLDRVRFTGPVPVGARLRIRATLRAVSEETDGGVKVAWLVTFEIEGGARPVCVAETLAKLHF